MVFPVMLKGWKILGFQYNYINAQNLPHFFKLRVSTSTA